MKNFCFIYQNAFSQTGGIQTFNKYFISALEEISEEDKNVQAEFVSIYDNEQDVKSSLPFTVLGSSKLSAFKYIIANAKNFDTYIFAHVNLAPLAIVLHFMNPKARIIFSTYGIEVWKKLPIVTEWIMNKSTILTISNFTIDELKKYNSKLKGIRLFPCCIGSKVENIILDNPFNAENYNVLSVTRLSSSERLKGIDTVIKALPLLKDKIPNIKYSVIGRGEDIERLQKLANDLDVSEYVEFLGFVDDINAYYQHCDIFTLPSKKEGFGIVYLEAMQYKKPVIAVNYGGPTDVVMDAKTGFLCEYDDKQCLAEKFLTLYENRKLAEEFGKNGYSHLIENFTFNEFKRRLKEVINDNK